MIKSKTIKVIVVDDHELFRGGLKLAFSTVDDIDLVAEASGGEEFLEIMGTVNFDVVLMDIKMKGISGIETIGKAIKKDPSLKVIVLSTFGEEEFLHQVIFIGAKGFLIKNVDKNTLIRAIKSVYQGQNYFSPELLPYFTQKYLGNENNDNNILLTKREREVLQLIGEGYSNAEIAEKLFISIRTVDSHKTNLISKTGSKNIVSLLVYAIKNNLVKID